MTRPDGDSPPQVRRRAGQDPARPASGTAGPRPGGVADRIGQPEGGGVTILVDLSQDTLATWIAASRATVARTLAELRQHRVIHTEYRKITITDPARLHSIAKTPSPSG